MKRWQRSVWMAGTLLLLTLVGAGCATARGVTSGMGPERVRIVVDGTTLVNLSDLTLIPTRDLEEIRVLSGIDATTYFGTNSVAGAVLITTRR